MNKQKTKTYFTIMLIITLLYTLFIWSNSIMSGEISTIESEGLRAFINRILSDWGIKFQLTSHLTRKLAHFCEFALLGFLCSSTISTTKDFKIKKIILSLPICLSVAIIDESIQIFTPDRACQFKDICIDFSGSLCGCIALGILYIMIQLIIKKIKRKERIMINGKNNAKK